MWDVGCGIWDEGCGMWDVGCGMWDIGYVGVLRWDDGTMGGGKLRERGGAAEGAWEGIPKIHLFLPPSLPLSLSEAW